MTYTRTQSLASPVALADAKDYLPRRMINCSC